jgi:hypothetical protein
VASQSTLLGAAGEYYVMAELLRRGFIAALAPQAVPNCDVVVTNVDSSQLCSIQVKTRRDLGTDGGWHMKAKHECIRSDRLFYCFVDFGKTAICRPTVHILPSAKVADALTRSHKKWLETPGKNGRKRKDSVMRRLLPDYPRVFGKMDNPFPAGWLDPYRDAWKLLGLEPSNVEGAWTMTKTVMKGVVHGRTIELETESGLPDGQAVSVTLAAAVAIPQDRKEIWEGIEKLWRQSSIDSQGDRLTRDQLHDRR